jgi:hypothetical protein
MTQLKITTSEINNEVIVFDGGNNNTPPIHPSNGIQWCSISVRELCTKDKTRGDIGLTFPRIEGTSPFIPMPRTMAVDIIGECGLPKIYKALNACEKLRRVALSQSDKKRVFTDYGKQVTYACVGPQVSRNSKCVLNNPPFMDNLLLFIGNH